MFNFFSKFIRSSIFLPALFLHVLCSPTLFLSFTYTTFYAFTLLVVDCVREYKSAGMRGRRGAGRDRKPRAVLPTTVECPRFLSVFFATSRISYRTR